MLGQVIPLFPDGVLGHQERMRRNFGHGILSARASVLRTSAKEGYGGGQEEEIGTHTDRTAAMT